MSVFFQVIFSILILAFAFVVTCFGIWLLQDALQNFSDWQEKRERNRYK